MKTIYTLIKDEKSTTGILVRQGPYGIFRDFIPENWPKYFDMLAQNIRSGMVSVEKFWWSKIK